MNECIIKIIKSGLTIFKKKHKKIKINKKNKN